jgi:hypothetical protein
MALTLNWYICIVHIGFSRFLPVYIEPAKATVATTPLAAAQIHF